MLTYFDASERARFEELLADPERDRAETARLVRLIELFLALPLPPDPIGLYPEIARLRDALRDTLSGTDGEALEEAFLFFYAHLHGHEAPYTGAERARVDESGGYWCHAGGLSPILKAPAHLGPDSIVVDLGAGNGLQGLLMQHLRPHAKTIQIEISARMIESGRALQRWLGIASERVDWVHADLLDAELPAVADLVYLYRPVRPAGPGRPFYRRLARHLEQRARAPVVFSIADCLRPFLSERFETFYCDGQLTCMRRR